MSVMFNLPVRYIFTYMGQSYMKVKVKVTGAKKPTSRLVVSITQLYARGHGFKYGIFSSVICRVYGTDLYEKLLSKRRPLETYHVSSGTLNLNNCLASRKVTNTTILFFHCNLIGLYKTLNAKMMYDFPIYEECCEIYCYTRRLVFGNTAAHCLQLKDSLVLVFLITITFTTSIQYCSPQIHMKYMLQNCTAVV